MKKWTELSMAELDSYIGLRLLMGVNLRYRDYWSTDPLHNQKIFPDTMSRDR